MMIAFIKDPTTAPDDSCMAGMGGVAFSVPGADKAAVEMEPVTVAAKGIRGLAPAGWTEAGPGAYVRASSALDETALIMDSAPLTAAELFGRLAGRMGFDPGLKSVAREEAGHFIWDLYRFELQGLSLDLALAEGDGHAYMVLLVARPDERDTLYEQVFRPAVAALSPID